MPKYYCDYCDTYLTHDSPSVRKTHCTGRKHKENVRDYYQKWMEEQAQKLIDQTTAAFKSGKMGPTGANPAFPPRFGMPPPMMGMPPRMMMPPGMMPPPGLNPMMMMMQPPPGMGLPPTGMPPGLIPPPLMMPPPPQGPGSAATNTAPPPSLMASAPANGLPAPPPPYAIKSE